MSHPKKVKEGCEELVAGLGVKKEADNIAKDACHGFCFVFVLYMNVNDDNDDVDKDDETSKRSL